MVSEVLTFNENTELLPSGDSYDNDPTERIPLVIVGITIRKKLGWMEVAKED